MQFESLVGRVRARYDGLLVSESYGEHGLFYNPGGRLAKGAYFLTVKTADGPNDRASDLGREGVYRVSFQVSPETYREQFGAPPVRPPKGGVVDTGHAFTTLDSLTPHPVYGWARWVCVLTPSERTLEALWPLVDESYAAARERFGRRLASA